MPATHGYGTGLQRDALSDDPAAQVGRLIPLATELAYKKEFPWPALKEIAKRGYFGAMIPKEYGGHLEEWGVTGACIIAEELGRAGDVWAPFTSTMVGSVHQILHFGTEEQKRRWLSPLARGDSLGAITITEPFVGSDASNVLTEAEMDQELQDLERQNLVDLYRDKKGKIALARATYEGLARVHPPEYYRSIPGWADEKYLF